MLDDSGNISRVNPAFERATGYAESDIIGREIIRFVVMDDWAIFLRSFTAVNPDPFRLMHRESGTVKVRLIAVRFKQQRGFIVLRRTA